MGTSNFYWQNAKNCYAIIAEDYYNEDGEILDEYEEGCEVVDRTDDEIDYIEDRLKEDGWDREDKWLPGGWDSKLIASRGSYKEVTEGTGTVWITKEIILRCGYYEGANLDWDFKIEYAWDYRRSEYDDLTAMAEDITDDLLSDWNEGLRVMNRAKIVRRVLAILEKTEEDCEKVCKSFTTPLRVSACFSNGETWYEKITE